jgi:ABC-type branched-subunit amino acid transport system substrate-binding protein
VRTLFRTSFLVAGAALALVSSACGGDSPESASTSASGSTAATSESTSTATSKPTGAPIKIGQIVPVGGQVDYPDMRAAAAGAVAGINARGGLDGRPFELVFCNEGNSPNAASACAHKLVKEGVVAAIGGLSLTAEKQISTILNAAGVPQVSDHSLGALGFITSPNEYAGYWSTSSFVQGGLPKLCAQKGAKNIALPYLDLPVSKAVLPFERTGAKAAGAKVVTEVPVPVTTTDFAPVAQKLISAKADCIVNTLLPAQTVALMKAMLTLGAKPTLAISSGALTAADYNTLKSMADQIVVGSPFPVPTNTAQFPVFEQFQSDMKAQQATGDEAAPYNDSFARATALSAWFGVQMVKKVLEQSDGEPTPSALMSALKQVKDLDLGLPTKWNPNNPGPEGFPRAWGQPMYTQQNTGTGLKDVSSTPFDAIQLMQSGG